MGSEKKMIYTIAKVTVRQYDSVVDRKIILYRSDKEVELQFEIVENKFKQFKIVGENVIDNMGASYGQLIIRRESTAPIISEVAPTKDGRIIFVIKEDMIDENVELGTYDFQIRLFDETLESRVTLPPVIGEIEICEPIVGDESTEDSE